MKTEKKYGVMVATPCYGGQLTEAYLHGLLQLTTAATRKGIQVHLNTMGNESLITRARNTLVCQFLDADAKEPERFSHLLFIDSDIGFKAENAIRLIESASAASPTSKLKYSPILLNQSVSGSAIVPP